MKIDIELETIAEYLKDIGYCDAHLVSEESLKFALEQWASSLESYINACPDGAIELVSSHKFKQSLEYIQEDAA